MNGQISMFDYLKSQTEEKPKAVIDFKWFRDEYCSHPGAYLKFDKDEPSVLACSYKYERRAESWADWQKCTEENCPFMRKLKECGDACE